MARPPAFEPQLGRAHMPYMMMSLGRVYPLAPGRMRGLDDLTNLQNVGQAGLASPPPQRDALLQV